MLAASLPWQAVIGNKCRNEAERGEGFPFSLGSHTMFRNLLQSLPKLVCTLAIYGWLALIANSAQAQGFGVESHNTLMPASGGMAGTSIARPQDLTSSMNANAATLTQFKGTQF